MGFNQSQSIRFYLNFIRETLSDREDEVGAFVCSDVINSVFTGTTTLEVNSAVSVEGSDVRVSEVLELGEDEVGVTVSSDVVNSVLTGTTTLEVNSAPPVEGSNVRVSEVHEF